MNYTIAPVNSVHLTSIGLGGGWVARAQANARKLRIRISPSGGVGAGVPCGVVPWYLVSLLRLDTAVPTGEKTAPQATPPSRPTFLQCPSPLRRWGCPGFSH